MTLSEVEDLDDARWCECLARADFLENQETDRIAEGVLRAVAAVFKR